MNIKIHHINNIDVAELIQNSFIIIDIQDILDIMSNSAYLGSRKIIIYENQLPSDFFDLKTKVAGDILQKFSNYKMQLAIIGDFTKYKSKSLKDFIFESNWTGRILFVSTVEEAKQFLTR